MLDLRPTTRPINLTEYASPWTLIHGEALDVLQGLPDGLADGLIADPPYSSGGMMRSDRAAPPADKYSPTIAYPAFSGDNRDARSWAFWCVLWLTECLRIVKPGGYLLMFSDWRQLPMATDVFQSASGAVWRGIISWDKGPTARAPHTGYARHQCEYIIWGSVGQLEAADGRGPFPGSYTIPVDPREKEHLAGKPVELMRKLARMIPEGACFSTHSPAPARPAWARCWKGGAIWASSARRTTSSVPARAWRGRRHAWHRADSVRRARIFLPLMATRLRMLSGAGVPNKQGDRTP